MAHTRSETRASHGATLRPADSSAASDIQHPTLEPFVGRWHMEGQQLPGPTRLAAPISALQTYEWLPGKHVLVHRFDGHIGDHTAASIESISFDDDRQCYRAYSFYDNGQMN